MLFVPSGFTQSIVSDWFLMLKTTTYFQNSVVQDESAIFLFLFPRRSFLNAYIC